MLPTLCLALAMAQTARATPIRPTAQQLLRQAQQPVMPYLPAQVGWRDPSPDPQSASGGMDQFNTVEILRNAEAARARREILLQVARPDLRVILAFGAIVFLLRRMRTIRHGAGLETPIQASSH